MSRSNLPHLARIFISYTSLTFYSPMPYFGHQTPAVARRKWLEWALSNIHPSFEISTEPRHDIYTQLHNVYSADTDPFPRLTDTAAWERLKEKWCRQPYPANSEVPSAVDCEIVRLVNKGKSHDFLEQGLRENGWSFLRCCDNSLPAAEKGLLSAAARVARSECQIKERKDEPEKGNRQSESTNSVAAQAATIVIPDGDEKSDISASCPEKSVHRTGVLSTGFAKNLRPILRDMFRDGMMAMSTSVMDQMRNRTILLLGQQENAHFGFATLRDVEAQTIKMLEAEVSELSKGFIEKLVGLGKDDVDVKVKRSADELEESEIADDDRQAKRQRLAD
ncbi:hypothetical protein CkaCkLH20_09237 [Colletotrichum karsti]|uniref:Uncharacterized protein n=1 Tax=Colletotrichum karsti TaxID=1095194 RepID=A0A9P6HZC8_9PEZI|nr:uncharacterized protein CkaCkLH20_09237 [Colletotrichum karsti]KAF9873424.1 hypothetical protein CkaCkLH20_09237 [Colletotrichum karsti]